MKDERKTEIRVGITVLAAVVIFLFVLGWAKNISLTEHRNTVVVKFDNIAGLSEGDAVMMKGYKCGRVESIEVLENAITTKLIIDENVKIYDDAKFYIMMLDLMGGKKVEIDPGISGIVHQHKIYEGEFLGDISTAMAMLSSVQNDLVDLTKELKITLNKTNEILTDESFKNSIKKAVANLSEAGSRLNKFISDNDDQLKNLIENTNSLIKNSSDFLSNNQDDVKSLLNSTKSFIDNSSSVVEKLDVFISEINNDQNNAGKILHDPDLIPNLKNTMERLKELTEILINQLKTDGLNVDVF